MPFDLNKDNQKDMLVTYTDGSMRILKNDGPAQQYKNLGTLMVVADGIQNIYVGDTDGNKYEDVIIQTTNNKLRVYNNDQ